LKELKTNNDYDVPSPPSDSVSALAWSPTANILAAASWDNQVRIWEVASAPPTGFGGGQIAANPKIAYPHEGPVLCCNFSKDGTNLFSGGCDKKVLMKNLATQQQQQVGQHDAPVKEVFWVDEMKMICSASWDKTIRFWTGTQATPAATLTLPQPIYSMDVKYPLLVAAGANREVYVYNLQTIQQNPNPYKHGQTTLKMQTRCVTCFQDRSGYAVGSIEGRCSIVAIEDMSKNFSFKCHRTTDEICAVNAIDFHPTFGTFATAGADGTFVFWDKDHRQRLKSFPSTNYPITCGKFNAQGDLYAYGVGYDWGKGHEFNLPNSPNKILIHRVTEQEAKSKPGAAAARRR
jgi:mRNA export factor